MREPNGPKDALWADITEYESGSDHWIYQEGSFAVPTIYLRDWPDIYIHTNKDIADNVDPTKIKRSAFIAATIKSAGDGSKRQAPAPVAP